MKNTCKTTGRIVFGNSVEMSTIDAIKSTRENIDLLYPERMTYAVHHKGRIYYTLLEIEADKIKTIDGWYIELSQTNMIYIIVDDSDIIEPLTKSKNRCNCLEDIKNDTPILISWRDNEILEVTKIP